MEVLVRAYRQLAEAVRSMTPAARVSAALALVVAAVSLVYLVQAERGGTDAWLMGGQSISAAQLQNMQAALGKGGVESHAEAGRLRVPRAGVEGHGRPGRGRQRCRSISTAFWKRPWHRAAG